MSFTSMQSCLTVIFFAVLLEESLVSRVKPGGSLDALLQSRSAVIESFSTR